MCPQVSIKKSPKINISYGDFQSVFPKEQKSTSKKLKKARARIMPADLDEKSIAHKEIGGEQSFLHILKVSLM
jgi:hypothetical protein